MFTPHFSFEVGMSYHMVRSRKEKRYRKIHIADSTYGSNFFLCGLDRDLIYDSWPIPAIVNEDLVCKNCLRVQEKQRARERA